ncbi:uncharacterized protein ACR2FA_007301 [Aphomia sociella]
MYENVEKIDNNVKRVNSFDRNVNVELIESSCNIRQDPKCKISLNTKLTVQEVDDGLEIGDNTSSRSSLYSIPSLEWDGKCKSEYIFRTRSLPRQKNRHVDTNKLYRTRSHGGFINNFLKDPEPVHYHLPRCRSCGANNNSYVWELRKEEESSHKTKQQSSIYYSVDNIPQKCMEECNSEANIVKVKEKLVPVYKITKELPEFVDSQEFTEDNYLGDIENSFNSENQTVIEKSSPVNDSNVAESTENDGNKDKDDTYRAEVVPIITEIEDLNNNNTSDSTEGEYHSFTDEIEFEEMSYESPVKDLVDKDIRDYSVPINFYCEDYDNKDNSPRISPQKRREIKATALEPILEESKSTYDDSSDSHNSINKNVDVNPILDNVMTDILTKAVAIVEVGNGSYKKITSEVLQNEYLHKDNFVADNDSYDTNDIEVLSNPIISAIDVYKESDNIKTNNEDNKDDIRVKPDLNSENIEEIFSITRIIEDLETNINFNETVLTETSESDTNPSYKVVEALIYYIFDAAFYMCTRNNKNLKNKTERKVVTVVDNEDILLTAKNLWPDEDKIINEDVVIAREFDASFVDQKDHIRTKRVSVDSVIVLKDLETRLNLDINNKFTYANERVIENCLVYYSNDDNTSIEIEGKSSLIEELEIENIMNMLDNEDFIEINEENNYQSENRLSDISPPDVCGEQSHEENIERTVSLLNNTFVLDDTEQDMNDAFVEDVDESENSNLFVNCNESPIKNTNDSFVGDDLSVLYEKDNTILGSPFVKKAPVISMSQTENTGGIKYWLSFDDNLTVTEELNGRTVRKFKDHIPSFVTVDFKDTGNEFNCKTDFAKRSSILLEDAKTSNNGKPNNYDYPSVSHAEYTTCDSDLIDCDSNSDTPTKRLIYDSRIDLHTKSNSRLYSSWPPFEQTLFYRIISKFRMSESFDTNEFDKVRIES